MGGTGYSKTWVPEYNSAYIPEESNLNEMVGVMVILYICNRDVLGVKPSMGYPEYFEALLSYSRKGEE